MATLKSKTLKGLFWSFSDSFGAYFIRFGFSVAIARALEPSDYGLMGMIIIFVAIGNLMAEGGFGMALIQKKEATSADFSTIFYFNLSVSVLIYLILFVSAPLISDFYSQPILVKVIRVSALTIVFGSLSTIQKIILTKELDFKRQTFISLSATLISGTTGVIIAYNGFAVWALVFQTMAGTVIRLIGFWLTSPWRPSFTFSWSSFKSLYSYSYKIFLSGFSDIVFTKLYYPLIGKYFSANQLGYYTNASNFSTIIVRQITIASGRVLFPSISVIQDDRERLYKAYKITFRLLAFVMFPISLIAILSSQPFVGFFLTEKWLPAVPYMRLFLVEGFFFSLFMLNQNTFNAIGQSAVSLKVEILKKSLIFSSLFITFQYGIKALIIGQLIGSFIAFIYSILSIRNRMGFKLKELMVELIKLLIITGIIVLIDNLIISKYITGNGLLLLSKIFILAFLFLSLSYALKLHAINDLCDVFNKSLPHKIIRMVKHRFE